MPLVTPQPRSEIGQLRTKSDVRVNPSSGRLRSNTALTSQRILALNKEADDQRRKNKHAHSAGEYRRHPNGPASVVLDNLKGYIGEVPSRHKTSKKRLRLFVVRFGARSVPCIRLRTGHRRLSIRQSYVQHKKVKRECRRPTTCLRPMRARATDKPRHSENLPHRGDCHHGDRR